MSCTYAIVVAGNEGDCSMNIVRGWKLRQVRRRRKLITALREANRQRQAAYDGFDANRAYHPSCMGGVEDKFAGERQWQGRINFWWSESRRLAQKLRITREQADKYR